MGNDMTCGAPCCDGAHVWKDPQGDVQRAMRDAAKASGYDEPGVKDDAGKAALDLVPWDAVLGAADVFNFGRRKYSAWNWVGLSKSRLFGAALRHLIAYWRGEDLDPETELPHLDHALCCVMMLRSTLSRGRDDRPGEAQGPIGREEELWRT